MNFVLFISYYDQLTDLRDRLPPFPILSQRRSLSFRKFCRGREASQGCRLQTSRNRFPVRKTYNFSIGREERFRSNLLESESTNLIQLWQLVSVVFLRFFLSFVFIFLLLSLFLFVQLSDSLSLLLKVICVFGLQDVFGDIDINARRSIFVLQPFISFAFRRFFQKLRVVLDFTLLVKCHFVIDLNEMRAR
jgi:hypothetical protein